MRSQIMDDQTVALGETPCYGFEPCPAHRLELGIRLQFCSVGPNKIADADGLVSNSESWEEQGVSAPCYFPKPKGDLHMLP